MWHAYYYFTILRSYCASVSLTSLRHLPLPFESDTEFSLRLSSARKTLYLLLQSLTFSHTADPHMC